MNKFMALPLTLVFLSCSVIAEPKQLVCSNPVDAIQKELSDRQSTYSRMGRTFDSTMHEEWIKECEGSEFFRRYVFLFDTEGLKNTTKSNVEQHQSTCFGFITPVMSESVSSTPSVITFSVGDNKFNIDRKTLKGGFVTERDYDCVIEEVDTSDNLL